VSDLDKKLKEIKERCDAATEGPVDAFRLWEKTHNRENYGRYDAFKAGYTHARTDVPMLLETVEYLKKRVKMHPGRKEDLEKIAEKYK